ncbi:MAG: arylesterase [Pseudomonadota bacterium]
MRKIIAVIVAMWPLTTAADEVVIAALGDSLTQGFGLIPEDGFVPQMARWLEAEGASVRLINAGVSGDTTAGGLSRVSWTLSPEVDGIIVALGGNDLLRGIDPDVSRANLAGILSAATDAGVEILLVGMVAPGNYGPQYKTRFDAMYPELSAEFETLYAPRFFAGIDAGEANLAEAMAFMQPDGIHPNADGVARIVAELGPFVLDLVTAAED